MLTQEEFREWVKHHVALFSGFGVWLQKVPKAGEAKENNPDRQEVLAIWYGTLKRFDLEALKAASLKYSNDHALDDRPPSYSQHRAAVGKIASGIRSAGGRATSFRPVPRTVDGEEAYHCLRCRDLGWVWVWATVSVRYADDRVRVKEGPCTGNGDKLGACGTLYEAVVACTCKAADSINAKATRFSDASHLAVGRFEGDRWRQGRLTDPEEQQRLVDWVAGRHEQREQSSDQQTEIPF